jgi:hyperosmotically inducible protein
MKKFLGMLMVAGAAAAATTTKVPATDLEIAQKVAKEVRMYTRYTIWDNINLRVNEGEVELIGEVSQPWKKKDLERLAQRVAGVTSVTNRLKVLPNSLYDDELRIRIARAIYRHPALSRYAIQAVPPIHIIVDNGRVKLEGVVNNELEKTVAGLQAGTAGLSFGAVENNLRVENPAKKKNG